MPRVHEMFVFVISAATEDDEGVLAVNTAEGMMPMVGADTARVEALRPYAQQVADGLGKEIRLMRFTKGEVTETITPAKVAGA